MQDSGERWMATQACGCEPEQEATTKQKQQTPVIHRSNLADIDISKAYTGTFMRIRAIPVFNEFDTWQPYKPDEPLKNMSLYI